MTQEAMRGLVMIAWAVSISRYPHLRGLPLYGGLERLVAWVGRYVSWLTDPALIWAGVGILLGAGVILAAVIGERTGCVVASWWRRMLAIASIGYWLAVAAGFAEVSPSLPAVIAYGGFAFLHGRTATGLPAR